MVHPDNRILFNTEKKKKRKTIIKSWQYIEEP